MRLGFGPFMLLLIGLELSHHGGDVIVRVVGGGVDGDGSVGGVGVPPLVGGGSLSLLDFLDVGFPNVSSCFASLESNHDEGDDISKNYKCSRSTRPTRTSLLPGLRSIPLSKQIVAIPWTSIRPTASF